MHRLIRLTALFLLLICRTALGAGAQDYILLDDYLAENPLQRSLMEEFRRQVQQPARPLERTTATPVRIAVLYPGEQISDYWRRSVAVFRKRLDELGFPYELNVVMTRPVIEDRLLEEKLAQALAADPDYLVFTLDSPAHARIVERLLSRSRPKLILQNITTPVRNWGKRQPMIYIGFDHQLGTRLLARAILNDPVIRPRRFSVLFWGEGYVSEMRGRTFITQAMKSGAEIRSQYYTQGNRESAREAALDALKRDPDLDFIYASATDLAFGAMDAVRTLGLQGKVHVNGWGGGEPELEAMAKGELDVTVVRINDENGIAMAEAIRNDLAGLAVPQVYSGSMEVLWQREGAERRKALHDRAFSYEVQ